MAAPKSLFDLYLGPHDAFQGYRCRAFTRDSAPLVASRFSTAQEGETDLDLIKNDTLEDLEGGMFQRDWDDEQKVARAVGIFNKYDKNLYPTPPRSTPTAVTSGYYPLAKAESDFVSFIAYGYFSSGTYYNLLYKITSSGGYASVTLPAALSNNLGSNITGMVLFKSYLFVCSESASGNQSLHRYNISANTWQNMTNGSFALLYTLRGLLYAIKYTSGNYAITGDTTTTGVYTALGTVGSSDPNDAPTAALEFNGAAYIAKPSGIYRFDGVNSVRILTHYTKELRVFNGALYFFSGLWLYRFDGVTVTRLQFFGTAEKAENNSSGRNLSLAADSDYLYISTVMLTTAYADDDKFSPTANGLKRIYTYDGVGFLLLHEVDVTFGSSYSAALVANRGALYDILGNVDAFSSFETSWHLFDMTLLFKSSGVTTASRCEFTISEHDAGYPNVFKSLEYLTPLYSDLVSGDLIEVRYQYHNGITWSAWEQVASLSSSSLINKIEIQDQTKKLYKRLKVNVTLTPAAGSTAKLKGVSLGFTVQPRIRWRWNIMLMADGKGYIEDRSGTDLDIDANLLNNLITQNIKSKIPCFMLAPDYGIVKTQITNSALSFIIKGRPPIYSDPYNEYPLVAVKNNSSVWEILRVSTVSYNAGADETTLTVLERGYLGITAAQINADAEFHLCYRVYITRLLRENTILDEDNYSEQTTGESQIRREFLIEATEV